MKSPDDSGSHSKTVRRRWTITVLEQNDITLARNDSDTMAREAVEWRCGNRVREVIVGTRHSLRRLLAGSRFRRCVSSLADTSRVCGWGLVQGVLR